MPGSTTQPVREWQGALIDARTEFADAWERDPGTSKGAAEAIAAMRRVLERNFANWEALDLPDTHAPPTAERALSDMASWADGQRVIAAPFLRDNDFGEALKWLLRSFRSSVDFEVLNDLAVMMHAQLHAEDAIALLVAVLSADPEREDARENLEAILGKPAP
jgi:hypothetical protein